MVRTKKKDQDPLANIIESISYGTGLVCAKVANLGKVGKSKEWKGIIKSTEQGLAEMKESFDEGVNSIIEETKQHKTFKPKKKDEEVKEEVKEVKEEDIEVDLMSEEPLEVKLPEIKKKKSALPSKPKKKVVEVVESIEVEEEEQDEEVNLETVKTQTTSEVIESKVEADTTKEVQATTQEQISHPMLFTMEEFKKEGKNPQDLIDSICKNKSEIYIEAPGPIEWLNQLITYGFSGLPLQYDIPDTDEIKAAKEALENAHDNQLEATMIIANRLILQSAYPLKCPKVQITEQVQEETQESEAKPKSKKLKQSISESN